MTKLEAFLTALPHARDEEFVNAPGLGTFRAKFVRRGLERGVLAVHETGMGLTLVQPSTHGVCPHCAARKGSDCTHCACALCSWFRQTDELTSPRVSREKMQALTRRLKAFRFATDPAPKVPALDDDI